VFLAITYTRATPPLPLAPPSPLARTSALSAMVLTANQRRALSEAVPAAKAAMRAVYSMQNSGQVPGRARDAKQAARARPRRRQGQSSTALQTMPRGAAGPRGVMPDSTQYHWDQTPASSNVVAPRGFGYYDAFTHGPQDAVTSFSVGPATPIQANTRANVETKTPTGAGAADLGVSMIIVYPAVCDTQAVLYQCGPASTDPVFSARFNSPQLAPSGGPEAAMATRCSLQIRNITQVLNQGGVVRSLRVTTGIIAPDILYTGTSQDLLDLAEHVRNHARTRSYAGADLVDNKQINCTVVDQPRATTFLDFQPKVLIEDLPWYPQPPAATPPGGAVGAFTLGLHNPTYTPIILLFESFPTANSYEISIRTQFLSHYVQGSMLANLAVTAPSVGDKLNPHRDNEERRGSVLHDVGQAIEQAGKWALTHGGEIMGGMGAARWALPRLGPALGYAGKLALTL
jgi:hypothetical protein